MIKQEIEQLHRIDLAQTALDTISEERSNSKRPNRLNVLM
jgi:hypothetical protein